MEAATADGGSGCRLTSFMMCRRGSRPKSVRQDTGRRIPFHPLEDPHTVNSNSKHTVVSTGGETENAKGMVVGSQKGTVGDSRHGERPRHSNNV
jgi:hypothetical protein